MKSVEYKDIKTLCSFYVSDVHLSVMLIPYISKQLSEDVEVTTIFENLDKQKIEEILNKTNVKDKRKILKIDWSKKNNSKIKKLNKVLDTNKDVVVIIGGSQKFISSYNEKVFKVILNKEYKYQNIKVINCFDINEVNCNVKNIAEKYGKILNTTGEKVV